MKRGGLAIILTAAILETVLQAYVVLGFQGQWLPDFSCAAVVDAFERIEAAGRWYHDHKNVLTEAFRCDAQWWSKFTIQAIGTLTILNLALVAWVISLKMRRA